MDYRREFSAEAEQDLKLIFDYLFASFRSLGNALERSRGVRLHPKPPAGAMERRP